MDNKTSNTLPTIPEKGETVPLLLEGVREEEKLKNTSTLSTFNNLSIDIAG